MPGQLQGLHLNLFSSVLVGWCPGQRFLILPLRMHRLVICHMIHIISGFFFIILFYLNENFKKKSICHSGLNLYPQNHLRKGVKAQCKLRSLK